METAVDMLEDTFQRAVAYVGKANLQLSSDQKLKFYGLFKQATIGNCNTSRPAFYDMIGRAKWDAWNSLKETTQEECKMRYIKELEAVDPDWSSKSEPQQDQQTRRQHESGTTGGPVFSMPERPEQDATPRDICFWASQGDAQKVQEILRGSSVDVNWKDEEGRAAIHYACDRGHKELLQLLLNNKAGVNLQDEEGQTPAHYAILVENSEILQLLLEYGADVNIKDASGVSVKEAAESQELQNVISSFRSVKM